MAADASVEVLVSEVKELRARVALLERRRRRWSVGVLSALVLVGLSSRVSFASGSACGETLPGLLTPFCPDEPAQSAVVNQNFRELIRLVETKVGALGVPSGTTPGAAGSGSISTTTLTTTGALSAGSLSTGAVSATSLNSTSATIGTLNATSQPGFELSCGEAAYLGSTQGNPFCCRINVSTGDTTCNLATNAPGTTWSPSVINYPGLSATTTGRYSLSCVAGAPGANFPFCCRINVNNGAVTCGQGNNYSLGSAGQSIVPF